MAHSSSPIMQTKQLNEQNTSAVTDEEQGNDASSSSSLVNEVILKIPHLTIIYWCEKMTATTFGETFADFFSQTLGFGYTSTSAILISVFFCVSCLADQSEDILAYFVLGGHGIVECRGYAYLRLH
jgi:Repeat of Unknown Function (DUF347)